MEVNEEVLELIGERSYLLLSTMINNDSIGELNKIQDDHSIKLQLDIIDKTMSEISEIQDRINMLLPDIESNYLHYMLSGALKREEYEFAESFKKQILNPSPLRPSNSITSPAFKSSTKHLQSDLRQNILNLGTIVPSTIRLPIPHQ